MTIRTVALVYPACHRRGGVERCVREVARRLAATYQVSFVGDEFDPSGMQDVTFEPVGGRRLPGFLAPLSFRYRAARALRSKPHDRVISWGAECPPGDVEAVASVHRAWLRRGRPIPTKFGTIPNWVRYLMPQHFVRLALEYAYFRTKRKPVVSVLSQQNADEVATLYGVPAARTVIIPNGYSGDEFSADRSRRERAERRRALELSDGDVLVLLVANELHRKGFRVLVEAVAAVADPRVRVAVVGRAPVDVYQPLIDRLGLAERVRWYGPSDDVAAWYAAADLFVMPSQYEAYPLVVIEALASGVPVITTAFAGSIDAVRPGINGLLLDDPDDVAGLAELLKVGLDDAERARWHAAAADSVRRLEWGEIARRYVAVLEQGPSAASFRAPGRPGAAPPHRGEK